MSATETEIVRGIGSDYEIKYGFHVPENYFFKSGRGLSHELVDAISSHKDEPDQNEIIDALAADEFRRIQEAVTSEPDQPGRPKTRRPDLADRTGWANPVHPGSATALQVQNGSGERASALDVQQMGTGGHVLGSVSFAA